MPTLLLIRHGENDYVVKGRLAGRLPGVHLNENGRQQTQWLVEKLAGAPIKAIYSSPLERALETAGPLAEALNLAIIVSDGLLETDIGEWQGRTIKSMRREKLWRVVQTAPSLVRFPGSETLVDTQYRVTREIETICAQYAPDDMIICVSHGDPIKLAVAHYIGLPLDNFQRLVVAPASITALQITDRFSRLVSLNLDNSFNRPKP